MREAERRLLRLEKKTTVKEVLLTIDQQRRIFTEAYRSGNITLARYNELIAQLEESDDGLS